MTPELTVAERPLPVVLRPVPDELLSSWLRRHVTFYGLTEPMFLSWLRLGTKNLRSLDSRLGLGQVTRIVEKFQCDPKTIVEMTHASLPTEIASLVRSGRPSQFCRPCWERHRAADAHGAVLKNWREGWRPSVLLEAFRRARHGCSRRERGFLNLARCPRPKIPLEILK
jgi:hypothetical protein